MRRLASALAPVALLATGACFATHQDVQLLRNDLMRMRAEAAHADSARSAQLGDVITSLGTARDSLKTLSANLAKFQGDVRGDLYAMGQQLIQVQELTGQSQQRLQELRASLDQRNAQMGAQQPPPGDTSAAASAAAAAVPGPNQLFDLSLKQLQGGSPDAALTGFQTLLQQYPTSDVAPDAQFYIGEAFSAQGDSAAADSAYAKVVAQYPQSARAPTALYKRALLMIARGNSTGARAELTRLIRQYPHSDEARLARDRLKELK
ncbi:MAG TPA: tol-pal system protein YbgF [Gemmatimonadaceae bacterium]|nr:tol-pal system protein YbgF [Gemmatimonadaceae bacterium]